MTAETSLPRVVTALGSAQIVSWGTLFYTIAVLGPPMRAELGIGDVWLFGSFTAGLGLSGLLSPAVGRAIDARGGRQVLAAGSVLGALALATLAAAQGPWSMLAGWALAGVAMSAALYDPAFATLHQLAGASYRRSVTALTLFGGFASTVFWPLSQWLQETGGWRLAFAVYALLHLVVCLPLHLLVVPRTGPRRRAEATAAAAVQPAAPAQGRAFAWLATALALASFLGSALSAHLMGFLTASGLTMREAVLVGAVVGPMQVTGRIMELFFLRRLAPLAVGTLAFAVLAIALLLFTQVHGVLGLALAFAVPLWLEPRRRDHRARHRAGGALRRSRLRRAARSPGAAAVHRPGGRAGRVGAGAGAGAGPRRRAVAVGGGRVRRAGRVSAGDRGRAQRIGDGPRIATAARQRCRGAPRRLKARSTGLPSMRAPAGRSGPEQDKGAASPPDWVAILSMVCP
ncbi:MAG: MFS transporter [Betaproteobacteria bacterium]|nr:MFS transporter [Betaproteobacteria bacterium]